MLHDEKSKTTLKSLLGELEEQNLKYELVLQAADMGVFDWKLEEEELEWDAKMYELHGYENKKFLPNYFSWMKLIHPHDVERVRQEMKLALKGKRPFKSVYRIITPHKKIRYIKAIGKIIRNDEGRATRIMGLNSNITDTIIKNNKIQQLTNDVITIFDAIPGMVMHKSKDDIMLKVNKYTADQMGTTVKAMEGQKSEKFFGKELSKKYHADDMEVINSGKPKLNIVERVLVDGERRWVRTDKIPYFDKDGNITGVVLCAFDITEERETKQSLERVNEELTQFAYRTSHDLKAPLSTIRSLSQIMLEDLEDGNTEEVKVNLTRIENLSDRLGQLITDMLNLTKADLVDDDEEEFCFEEEIEGIKESLVHYLEVNPVKIVLENKLKTPFMTKKSRIRQILENLISNGIKYSNQSLSNCFVKVELIELEQEQVIKISDNGIGIPKENKEEVFTMFKRFHTVQTGSGLGLSLVKKHVEALKGEISFESSDKGTTFSINLPKKI